jgi:hypothetical protein
MMKLPQFVLPILLRLHASAQTTPYYPIPDDGSYMERGWLLGYRDPDRNKDNPSWKAPDFVQPKPSRLYRRICKHVAVRAHTTKRSDRDRHLHDHPSWNASAVLEGGYWEVHEPTEYAKDYPHQYESALERIQSGSVNTEEKWPEIYGIFWRGPGAVVFRKRAAAHKLILPPGTVCKSIFIVGEKEEGWHWGFYVDGRKVYWKTYLGVE